MGARNYLIEGVSCTGKTSVCNELRRRGHHAIHGDETLAYQGDPGSGEPLDGFAHGHHIWDVDEVRSLVADQSHEATFFCGGSRNWQSFIDLFDAVFVLEVDLDTLNRRLALRRDDEWGGPASECAAHARLQHATKEEIPGDAIAIDATAPIARVVDAILDHAGQPSQPRDPDAVPASAFYTGLVAELYEPLAGERATAAPYTPFLDRSGTPALELACGSGLPLLELLERGYEVEGLDASEDMLERCRARAAERGLVPILHRAEMQSFALGRRYRSIFLAGASFTLLTSDADALAALRCMHAHLEDEGQVLIPLEVDSLAEARRSIGVPRETRDPAGNRLRVQVVSVEASADGRNLARRLRYERIPARGDPVVVERVWQRRSWSQPQLRELVRAAGFAEPRFRAPGGGPAAPDAPVFVALLRRAAP